MLHTTNPFQEGIDRLTQLRKVAGLTGRHAVVGVVALCVVQSVDAGVEGTQCPVGRWSIAVSTISPEQPSHLLTRQGAREFPVAGFAPIRRVNGSEPDVQRDAPGHSKVRGAVNLRRPGKEVHNGTSLLGSVALPASRDDIAFDVPDGVVETVKTVVDVPASGTTFLPNLLGFDPAVVTRLFREGRHLIGGQGVIQMALAGRPPVPVDDLVEPGLSFWKTKQAPTTLCHALLQVSTMDVLQSAAVTTAVTGSANPSLTSRCLCENYPVPKAMTDERFCTDNDGKSPSSPPTAQGGRGHSCTGRDFHERQLILAVETFQVVTGNSGFRGTGHRRFLPAIHLYQTYNLENATGHKMVGNYPTDGTNGALKSMNYTSATGAYYGSGNSSNRAFMYLQDVALGTAECHTSACWDKHRPDGYPTKADFIFACGSRNNGGFTHDELVTFDESAQMFRYLVEVATV